MTIKLNGSSSGSVSIDAPASTTGGADVTFKLPVADGSADQVLKTDASGNLGFATVASQAGKEVVAWVTFNGTGTVAIRDHYNVSSIDDNGTGKYTINFASALANSNYAVAGNAQKGDSNDDGNMTAQFGGANGTNDPTTTAVRVQTGYLDNTKVDSAYVWAIVVT